MRVAARLIEPLSRQHDRTRIDRGVDALNVYMRRQARQNAEKHVAAPFVLVGPPNAEVLGDYTLCASVLGGVGQIAPALTRKLPRYLHSDP